jgi:hypothetical protein
MREMIYWNYNKSDDEDNSTRKKGIDVVMYLTYVSLETNLCVSYAFSLILW